MQDNQPRKTLRMTNSHIMARALCPQQNYITLCHSIYKYEPLPWVQCGRELLDCFSPCFLSLSILSGCFVQSAASVRQMLMCVCLNLHGSQLKLSSVSDASEWQLHAACSMVWNRGEREQLRQTEGEAEGVESERDGREWGLCLHRELSKDNPSTSVEWRSARHWGCGWSNWDINVQCRRGG